MFTNNEIDYVKSLIETYLNKGYKYYLAHTITDNSEYDICIYFSKDKIDAMSDSYFDVEKGIKLLIDSSAKSTYNYDENDTASSYNGTVDIDVSEFIYTNAISEYAYTSIPLNPDITLDYKEEKVNSLLLIIVTILFIYIFIRDLLGIGGR